LFQFDITIIGAGVVGLSIAHQLSRDFPEKSILVLERNSKYGQETSARNSEVIHSGIYYPRNSLKAKLCLEGRISLYDLCLRNNISFQKITKIITATKDEAIPRLESLYQIGIENGVPLEIIDKAQANKLEPNIRCILKAKFLKSTENQMDTK
jgi:L-2-hydroxyglutarate oxidase LhgO